MAAILLSAFAAAAFEWNAFAGGDDRFEYTPCDPIPYRPYSRPDPAACARWQAEERSRRQKEDAADRRAYPKYHRGLAKVRAQLAARGYEPSAYSIIGTHVSLPDYGCVIVNVESTEPTLTCYKRDLDSRIYRGNPD